MTFLNLNTGPIVCPFPSQHSISTPVVMELNPEKQDEAL